MARNKAIITYPAAFTLIAAMNPCLCGYFGHPARKCTCSKRALYWFHRKISGPLLDRFDIQVNAEPVPLQEMHGMQDSDNSKMAIETSEVIRQRVIKARNIQQQRFKNTATVKVNAQMREQDISVYCTIDEQCRKFLLDRLEKLQMSPRAYVGVLKVARTIADLAGKHMIELSHVAEAIHLRALDHPIEKLTVTSKNYRHAV